MKILEDTRLKGNEECVVIIMDRDEGKVLVAAIQKAMEGRLFKKGSKAHKTLTHLVDELPVF